VAASATVLAGAELRLAGDQGGQKMITADQFLPTTGRTSGLRPGEAGRRRSTAVNGLPAVSIVGALKLTNAQRNRPKTSCLSRLHQGFIKTSSRLHQRFTKALLRLHRLKALC
jgi:hypothetical protein